jgi:hypothetical protein
MCVAVSHTPTVERDHLVKEGPITIRSCLQLVEKIRNELRMIRIDLR